MWKQIKCAEEFVEPLFADRLVVIDPLCSLIWIRGRKRTSPITQHDIVILKDSLHVFSGSFRTREKLASKSTCACIS